MFCREIQMFQQFISTTVILKWMRVRGSHSGGLVGAPISRLHFLSKR